MSRYFSYHVHFEHPSQTDPWFGLVEDWSPQRQDLRTLKSSLRTSLAANTASRLLDPYGRIQKIKNNLESLNFSIEPEYLDWIQAQAPNVYQRILAADRHSCERWSGRGNALASPWAGALLPLAPPELQPWLVRRGVDHFKKHFGRAPQGFWLPEAGVNTQVADTLLEEGLEFIFLAGSQVQAVADPRDPDWKSTGPEGPPPTSVYTIRRPVGDLKVLLGSSEIQNKLLHEGYLRDADQLYRHLLDQCTHLSPGEGLFSFSSGRLLGEWEAFGDMAMAALLEKMAHPTSGLKVCPAAWYCSQATPTQLLKLHRGDEDLGTALGCSHGLARWLRNCGCGNPGDSSSWKKDLRTGISQVISRILTLVSHREESLRSFFYEVLAQTQRARFWEAATPDDPRILRICDAVSVALSLLPPESSLAEQELWQACLEKIPTEAGTLGALLPAAPSWALPGATALIQAEVAPDHALPQALGRFAFQTTSGGNLLTITHEATKYRQTVEYTLENPADSGLRLKIRDSGDMPFQTFSLESLPGELRGQLADKAHQSLQSRVQSMIDQSGPEILKALGYHKHFQLALPPGLKSLGEAYFQNRLDRIHGQGMPEEKVIGWETVWAQAMDLGIMLDQPWSKDFLETQIKSFLGSLGGDKLLDMVDPLRSLLQKAWKWNFTLDFSVLQNEVWSLLEEKTALWSHTPATQLQIEKMDLLGEILGFNLEEFRNLFFTGEMKSSGPEPEPHPRPRDA